jgi:NMD protein affecting ribosome stability and mRNA decay
MTSDTHGPCIECGRPAEDTFCERCLAADARPSWVIGGEQLEQYEAQRLEWYESLPRA